jgi:hypothetical protein
MQIARQQISRDDSAENAHDNIADKSKSRTGINNCAAGWPLFSTKTVNNASIKKAALGNGGFPWTGR